MTRCTSTIPGKITFHYEKQGQLLSYPVKMNGISICYDKLFFKLISIVSNWVTMHHFVLLPATAQAIGLSMMHT